VWKLQAVGVACDEAADPTTEYMAVRGCFWFDTQLETVACIGSVNQGRWQHAGDAKQSSRRREGESPDLLL
jgi:hypothetical protein